MTRRIGLHLLRIISCATPAFCIPAPISVNPTGGVGAVNTLTVFEGTFRDLFVGGNNTPHAYFIFEVWPAEPKSCKVEVLPEYSLFTLYNDLGQPISYLPGQQWMTPGGSVVHQNSKCRLDPQSLQVTRSGNETRIRVGIRFLDPFIGWKGIYSTAYDSTGLPYGSVPLMTGYTVTGLPGSCSGTFCDPSLDSATPASGAGKTQEFVLNIRDSGGGYSIGQINLIIGPLQDAPTARCKVIAGRARTCWSWRQTVVAGARSRNSGARNDRTRGVR